MGRGKTKRTGPDPPLWSVGPLHPKITRGNGYAVVRCANCDSYLAIAEILPTMPWKEAVNLTQANLAQPIRCPACTKELKYEKRNLFMTFMR
jgi:phage FluMu protein Com